MSVFSTLSTALSQLASTLEPLFGASATAAAIIAFTLCIRLALHPLARAAARGEKARRELAPELAKLQRKHKGKPEKLQRATLDLYKDRGTSPLTGCGPALLQLPVFMVMYRLFSGHDHELLDHKLFGAPLGDHFTEAIGQHWPVYAGLFLVIAAVATWSFLHSRRKAAEAAEVSAPTGPMAPMAKWLPLLSFGTLLTAAIVPLAAGLYLATSTAWTAAERTLLYR